MEERELIAKAEVAQLMKGIRKALKLSQKEVADLSGLSRQAISMYETADMQPSIGSIKLYIEAISKQIIRLREFKERSERQAAKERSKESRRKVKE